MAGGCDASNDDFSGLDGPSHPHTVNTPATVELDQGQIPAQHAGLDKAWMYPGPENEWII